MEQKKKEKKSLGTGLNHKKINRRQMLMLVIPPAVTFLINSLVYWGAPYLTGGRSAHDLSIGIDSCVPLVPAFLIVYFGCYIFWVVNYMMISWQESEWKYRFFTADFYARMICFLFFVFFPTTNTRPELTGNGIFIEGMRFLYQIDKPVNLFPSIHCMASWFCCIGLRKCDYIPKWYKRVSEIIAVLVFISTLATKQHVFVDIIGGVAVAELTWQISCRTDGWGFYRRQVEKLADRLTAKAHR